MLKAKHLNIKGDLITIIIKFPCITFLNCCLQLPWKVTWQDLKEKFRSVGELMCFSSIQFDERDKN